MATLFSKNHFNQCAQWAVVVLLAVFVVSCIGEICPDHKMSCRKGQTCCDDKQGGFACCPYDNATCCSDGLHCCPEATTCDLTAGRCRRNKVSKVVKQKLLIPATNTTKVNDILLAGTFLALNGGKQTCPDQKQKCPSSYTCCRDPEEGYACCPYENATCCPDQIHCCPHGRKCGSGSCD